MTYITRDDGQRFIIPSYREMLKVKKTALLEKEIRLVSANYGDYVAIQKKTLTQYEVAFSPEPGYLLGETVWNYFKSPPDLIYCEEIADSNEAILVIVKSSSVYLDGRFPIDSIPDELVIFQTQNNTFDIYIYGNVPISKTAAEDKFYFDESSVKSFNILEKSVFAALPLSSQFELTLVDDALKKQGIGSFPIKKALLGIIFIALIYLAWMFFPTSEKILPVISTPENPYKDYIQVLTSPNPYLEIQNVENIILQLYSIPGWVPINLNYTNNEAIVSVKSIGARTNTLLAWAEKNSTRILVKPDGFYLVFSGPVLLNRKKPDKIYNINLIIAGLTDRLSYVLPGNNLTIGESKNINVYTSVNIVAKFDKISLPTLNLIGKQLANLPLILKTVKINFDDRALSGVIELTLVGN